MTRWMKKQDTKVPAIALALVASLAVGCDYETQADSSARALDIEGAPELSPLANDVAEISEEDGPALVQLRWADVTVDSAAETLSNPASVGVWVENLGGADYSVHVEVRADDGSGNFKAADLAIFDLASEASELLAVDLTKLGFDLESMRYSGRMHVDAWIYNAQGELVRHEFSPAIFFHPAAGAEVAIYNESTLRSQFNAGNYKAALEPALYAAVDLDDEEDQSTIDRITGGGGDSSVVALPAPEQGEYAPQEAEDEITPDGHLGDYEPPEPDDETVDASYTLCTRFQIQTNDSGRTNFSGDTEDWWISGDSGGTVPAYGVRVKVGSTTYDTDTSTGCITFVAASSVQDVRVYAYATNSVGSFGRIHNGADNVNSGYPGSTYSALLEDVALVASGTKTIYVGAYSARWTAMAALGMTLYRYPHGATNLDYHYAESALAEGCENQLVEADVVNNASYISIGDDSCGNADQRRKFLISHEYGHGLGYQYSNTSTQTPASSGYVSGGTSCTDGGSYSMTTHEWGSLAHREGFADFIAARVWNNSATSGTYHRLGTTYDLERWNSANTPRGYVRNVCCSTTGSSCASVLDGTGTRSDWMRGYWDLHTVSTCSPSSSRTDILRVFKYTITAAGLTNQNFEPAVANAIDDVIAEGQLGSCFDGRWAVIACHNGLDFDGTSPVPTFDCNTLD